MDLPFYTNHVYEPLQLTPDQLADVTSAGDEERHVLRTRPYEDGPGEEYAEEVIGAFHQSIKPPSLIESLIGDPQDPPEFTYEMWFDDGKIKFIWTVPDDYWYEELRRVITGEYPKIGIERMGKDHPTFNDDDYIAGGYLDQTNYKYIPIKGLSNVGAFEEDKAPLRLITSEVAGQQDTSALVQVHFEPAPTNWRESDGLLKPGVDRVRTYYEQGNYKHSYINPKLEDPTEQDLRIARVIADHEGDPAYYVTIRFFVFAPTKEIAQNHASSIGNVYRATYHNKELNQRLEHHPLTGDDLVDELVDAANRDPGAEERPMTVPELAALAHVPNGDVDTPNIDWTSKGLGSQAPSEAARKPETIDPRPYEQFGPEANANDALVPSASPLPPAEAENVEPDADATTGAESADESSPKEFTTEQRPGTAQFGQPREQIAAEKQSDFDTIVREVESANLTFDEIRARYDSNEEVENLINLIKKELEWRKSAPEDEETEDTEADTDTESTPARQVAPHGVKSPPNSPHNLPVVEGDYDDYGFTPAESRREWMLDPHTGEDRAYEIRVRKENPNGDDDWYMGRDVRNELFDSHRDHPDSPIWLGWLKDNRVGVREIGIEPNAWFRHFTVFGMTGMGKSTFQNNIMIQIAQKGYGFCYIDPKGDAVDELIEQLPEDRLDDVIWIEPGSTDHDKVVGINFLEPAYDKDHPNFDREVTSIVDDLTAILKGGDYWGPKMEGITTNIARAMIRSDINYTLLDMYYVLLSEDARQSFADMVKQEGKEKRQEGKEDEFVEDMENIHTYTQQIANMDYDEVDAVVRRIQHWVEDPIARGIVAHREGTVNITDAVEEGKIILVNINIDSEDIKEVVSTAIMRRVWAAIKARDEDEHDRTPFFSFIDEFDDVAAPEMDIEKMLSKARSGKMGVGLACQNPSQIPEAPRKQMFANARTLNTFGVGEPEDAGLISTRFGEEVERNQIMNIPQFTVYTRILLNTEDGPQLSDPMPINTFADYPPVRDHEDRHEVIEESLEKHGVKPLEETLEESQMVLFDMGNNITVQRALLQSIWEVRINRDTEYVALEAVDEAFEKRTGRSILDYPEGVTIDPEWAEIYHPENEQASLEEFQQAGTAGSDTASPTERLSDGGYTQAEADGTGEIVISSLDGGARVTEAGQQEVLSSDRYRARPTDTHRELLSRGVFEWFTRAGFTVNILEQSGSHSHPDAEGILPVESDTDSLAVAQESWETLKREFPMLAELSNGREVTFEAEVSLRKPAGPLQNTARAIHNNRRPIFIVPDGRREDLMPDDVSERSMDYWAKRLNSILTDPTMVRRFNVHEDENGNRRTSRVLYNTQDHLSLSDDPSEEKFPLIRKGSQCVWEEHDGQVLILYDGEGEDGKQRGKITPEDLDNASANAFDTWCRYDKYEDEYVVYPSNSGNIMYDDKESLKEDWQRVYKPFHPDSEIKGNPDDVDPLITILREPEYIDSIGDSMPVIFYPDGKNDRGSDPEMRPLIPEEHQQVWDHDLIPGYNPIEDTPEFLEDGEEASFRERIYNANESKQIMADKIDTSKEIGSTDIPETDYDPHYEPDHDFGGKSPTSRAFWEKVWDNTDTDLESPLEVEPLRDGLTGAAMPPDIHEKAINAGVESGHLIPSDIGLFLARPHQRPKVILDDYERYDNRNIWADVWRQNGREEDRHIPRRVLQISALDVGPFTGERGDKQTVTAAIEIALKRGALQTTEDNKIKLPPAGIPKKWKRVWDEYGADTDEAIDREFLEMTLRGIERLDSIEDAENKVQDAIHKNTLYETDNGIRINDPQSDEGPPLDSDDEDDDGDGAGSANDTDGGGGGGDADREDAETSTQDTGGEDSPDGDSGQADEADGTEAESGSETTLSGTPATDSDDTAGDNVTGPLDDRSDIDLDEGSGEVTEASADATDQTGDGEKPADGGADSTAADRTADEVGEDGGVGATLQTGDETAPDDYEGAEQWAITPTEQAPDEWKDAFAAAMDAYHDHLDTQIDENTWWNELVDAHRDQHHAAAAEDCLQHDHYVARCSSCVITADCDGCTHETETRPVARVEWTSCKDHDAIPKADCSDCSEVLYCHECSTDNADVDVDPTAPLEYVERVTCWNCEAFEEHSDVEGEPCSCETHTHEGPLHRLPETARDYFTGPDWSRDDTFSGTDLADQHTPHRHAGEAPDTIGRNWSNEIVEDRQLGWVPGTKPYEQPVANQLLEDDYTVAQLLATGLFDVDVRDISAVYSDDDDRSEYDVDNITDFDLEADIDDESHPLTAEDIIRPAWSGRPIFPAFNETGEPVYAYARQQKGRRHPNDYRENAKYLKLSIDDAYVYAREPIYGCDTLEEGTPTVITEGVADAITAHQHGLPCLSPVTTQFKDKHHEPLLDLLEAHDIDTILMIQDNEPGSFDPLAEDDYDHDDVEADIAGRKRWLLSDSQDLTEHIEEHDGPGPIGKAMEIDGVGPGLTGALTTASFLEDNGITAIQVDLPRFGGQKVDLDDYLSSGLHEYAPPLPAVQTLRRDLDTDEEAALLDQLVESAAFTHYYEDAVMDQCTDDEGDSIEADVLDAFATKLDAPPADDRSDLEWACLVYAARERMRNGILPSRADDATDWDVEAVQNVDGPETFDKNVVGILLGLGNPVAAVSDLTAAPRTPSFPVGEKPTASVDAGAAESAASPDESPASGRTATRFTPLFSGPAMYAPADHPKYEAAITQQALAELEQYDTDDADPAAAEDAGGDSGSVRRRNQLYDLSLRQVAGKKSGFRGKNPLGHVGESTNYFVMLTDDVAYDHKRKATFNALTYVAVDAGVRDITSPSGQFDHAEILETWVYAKQQGYIGSNARVPNRALNEAAVQMGVADYSDIGPREVGSGEDAFTISETLPADQYNEAIEAFEDHYDVDPGRSKITAESDFIDPELTTDNSAEKFGQRYLTADPPASLCKYEDKPPRTPVSTVWKAYQNWCELNDIDPQSQYTGGKKAIIDSVDGIEKKKAIWKNENIQTYFGGKLNQSGWWLYNWADKEGSE